MLKSYNYVKHPVDRSTVQHEKLFADELKLSSIIVSENPVKDDKLEHCCKICSSNIIEVFFEKWNVKYYRCCHCESIFVLVGDTEYENYKKDKRLISFRKGNEYQEAAATNRQMMWQETLEWILFRSYRYLGANKQLNVLDIGNKYSAYSELIKNSQLSKEYHLYCSIINDFNEETKEDHYDVAIMLDDFQQENNPREKLQIIKSQMRDDGLLFLSTRSGIGFDILTLKENSSILPYEHILLPSNKGLKIILEEVGFEILEYSTPGQMDVAFVKNAKDKIGVENHFIKSFIENASADDLGEFQRLLQKIGMSSYSRIVARKVKNHA